MEYATGGSLDCYLAALRLEGGYLPCSPNHHKPLHEPLRPADIHAHQQQHQLPTAETQLQGSTAASAIGACAALDILR
jgi:hypothetical protein